MRTDNINHFKHYSNVWLIGGARLLESCWELIDTLHLSRTYTHYDCDTFIDLLKLQREFSQISCETFVDHTYEIWGRR
jgi:dihydrofolate reductase